MKKYPIYLTMQQIRVLKEIFDDAMKHYQVDSFNESIELNSLNSRTRYMMRYEDIETYYELSKYEKRELLRLPNFGQTSLRILQNHVKQKFPDDWKEFKFLKNQW